MAALTTSILLGLAAAQTYKSLTDTPPALPPAPTLGTPTVRPRKNQGGLSTRPTLLTGPAGVTAPAPVPRKTLLGE